MAGMPGTERPRDWSVSRPLRLAGDRQTIRPQKRLLRAQRE
jgi:hypothetical protein